MEFSETAAHCADGAVGVPEKFWFIAVVNNKTEKICGERLAKAGYECYVPVQKEKRRWRDGRVRWVDRIVLPALIFIHSTESERKQIVTLPYIHHFFTDRAKKPNEFNRHPVATVPEKELETLRFMLSYTEAPVMLENSYPPRLQVGEKVRVIRGTLKDLEGHVSRTSDGKTRIIVFFKLLGGVSAEIDVSCLEVISEH